MSEVLSGPSIGNGARAGSTAFSAGWPYIGYEHSRRFGKGLTLMKMRARWKGLPDILADHAHLHSSIQPTSLPAPGLKCVLLTAVYKM